MADPHGVSIAFADLPFDTAPTWTRIDTLDGVRVQGWTVDRGRMTEFDKTNTGTAVVRLVDRAGLFDPTNLTSPYHGQLVPGNQAAIALQNPVDDTWHTRFRGFVEEWSYRLDPTRQYMSLELQLVDGFGLLSRMELQPGEAGDPIPPAKDDGNVFYDNTVIGSVKTRIDKILNDVGWPAAWREIYSGNVNLSEKVYSPGTSALAALQDAADGEFPGVANLYIDKEGVLVFHGRQPRFRPDVADYHINERDIGDPSATSLDPTVVPVSELEWSNGNGNLYNQCIATPEKVADVTLDPTVTDITGQIVTDAASVAAYGLRTLTFDNLQTRDGLATGNDALQETRLFAEYYVNNYKEPVPRITRCVFKTRRPDDTLGPALWNHMVKAEISDFLHLKTEHPGGGGFADSYFVEGLHYDCRPLNPDYPLVTLTLDLSPAAYWTTNPFESDVDPG